MRKILIVFGTRPEAIKLAPLVEQLKIKNGKFKTIVCVTAQHREMLDQVLELFEIKPDYDLDIMRPNQDLFSLTAKLLTSLKDKLTRGKPDLVIVQGDTTTSFVASLAAYYLQIPVSHIEAGLRTYDKYNPFPEEINRHLTGVLADFHFAPTEQAKNNLIKENVPKNRIWVTGNTVIDALLRIVSRQKSAVRQKIIVGYFKKKWGLNLTFDESRLILVTGHRRESFGEGFKNICLALREVAERNPDVFIVYPVHLNPNVQKPVYQILGNMKNIHLLSPLDYESFIFLMNKCYLVLTDSGGIQEEAPGLGKPVLVMRETTERPEGILAGTVKLVGTNKEKIVRKTQELLDNREAYEKMSRAINPYGDGKAAERIVKILEDNL